MTPNGTTAKRTVAVGLALVLVVSLGVGSVASTGQEGDSARVRVAHMSPDAPAVDVLVDNETAYQSVSFGDVTQFVELDPGDHRVTIVTADNESVVFDGQLTLEANQSYTVTAAGEVSENATRGFEPLAFRTDPAVPAENETAVRLVHVSPDAGPVDVTLRQSGEVVADNVTFGNATDYVTLPEGVYTLEVRVASEDDNGTVVATFTESLMGGTAYTAYAAGYAVPVEPPADEPLNLFVSVDAGGPMMTNETQMTDRAEQPEQAAGNETTTTEA